MRSRVGISGIENGVLAIEKNGKVKGSNVFFFFLELCFFKR